MKKIALIIFVVLMSNVVFAGEVTGAGRQVQDVLGKANLTRVKLSQMGLKVKLGEVTGAGKIHVDDIALLVLKNNVVNMNQVQHIEFVHPSQGKYVGEVNSFTVSNESIKKSNILAFIVQE